MAYRRPHPVLPTRAAGTGSPTSRVTGLPYSASVPGFTKSREREAFVRRLKDIQLGKEPKPKAKGTIFGRAIKAIVPKDVEVATSQISSSLMHAIPGMYEGARLTWGDVNRMLHGKPPKGEELKMIKGYGEQLYQDVRHPRRNIGYLAMDIATLPNPVAGGTGRVIEATRILRKGQKTVPFQPVGRPPPRVEVEAPTHPPKGGHTFSDEQLRSLAAKPEHPAGAAALAALRKRKAKPSSIKTGTDPYFDPDEAVLFGERIFTPKIRGTTRYGLQAVPKGPNKGRYRMLRFDIESEAGVPINRAFYESTPEGMLRAKRDLQLRTWEDIHERPSRLDDPDLFTSGRERARAQPPATVLPGGARGATPGGGASIDRPRRTGATQAPGGRLRVAESRLEQIVPALQAAVARGKLTPEQAAATIRELGLGKPRAGRPVPKPSVPSMRRGLAADPRALAQQLVRAVERGSITPQAATRAARTLGLNISGRTVSGQARFTRGEPVVRPRQAQVEPVRRVAPGRTELPTTGEVLMERLTPEQKAQLIQARQAIEGTRKFLATRREQKAAKAAAVGAEAGTGLQEFMVSERVTVPHPKFEGKTKTQTVQHKIQAADAQDAMRQAREAGIKVEGVASPVKVTKGGKTRQMTAAEYKKLTKEGKAEAKKAAQTEARAKAEARIAPIIAKEEAESSERLAMLAEQKRIAEEATAEERSILGDDFAEEVAGEKLPSFTLPKEGKKQVGAEKKPVLRISEEEGKAIAKKEFDKRVAEEHTKVQKKAAEKKAPKIAPKKEPPPAAPDAPPEKIVIAKEGEVTGSRPGHTVISEEDLRVDPEVWKLMTTAERNDFTRRAKRGKGEKPRGEGKTLRGTGLSAREMGMNKRTFDKLTELHPEIVSQFGFDKQTISILESKTRAGIQEGLSKQEAGHRAFVELLGPEAGNAYYKAWLDTIGPAGGATMRGVPAVKIRRPGPAVVPSRASSKRVGTTYREAVPEGERLRAALGALTEPRRRESYRDWQKVEDGELYGYQIALPSTAIWKYLRTQQLNLLRKLQYGPAKTRGQKLLRRGTVPRLLGGSYKKILKKTRAEDIRIQEAHQAGRALSEANVLMKEMEREAARIEAGEEIPEMGRFSALLSRTKGGRAIQEELSAQASMQRRGKQGIGAYVDAVNKLAVMGTLYAKATGYIIPNLLGQMLILGGDHAFNPIAVERSIRMAQKVHKISPDTGKMMKAHMFEGISQSLTMQTSASKLIDQAHGVTSKVYSKILDGWVRDAVFMHEAWQQGIRTPEGIVQLFEDPKHYGKLVDITKRANKNAVDYGRLNKFEQQWVRRGIFFYPWLKGATLYSKRFVVEHPIQTQIAMGMGRAGEEDVRRDIGPVPSYVEGSFKVGERNVPGLGKQPLVINPRAVQVLGTLGETVNVARAALLGSPKESEQLSSYFTPGLSAALAAVTRTDPFTGRTYPSEMGPADIIGQEMMQSVAPWKAIEDLKEIGKRERGEKTQEDVLFPYSKTERLGRYGLGVYPFALNTREARSRAASEARSLAQKSEAKLLLARDYQQRYLDAAKKVGFLPPDARSLPKPYNDALLRWGEREANVAAYKESRGKTKLSPIEALEADLSLLVRKKRMTNAAAIEILRRMSELPDSSVQSAHRQFREAYFGTNVISAYKKALNARLELSGESRLTVP